MVLFSGPFKKTICIIFFKSLEDFIGD